MVRPCKYFAAKGNVSAEQSFSSVIKATIDFPLENGRIPFNGKFLHSLLFTSFNRPHRMIHRFSSGSSSEQSLFRFPCIYLLIRSVHSTLSNNLIYFPKTTQTQELSIRHIRHTICREMRKYTVPPTLNSFMHYEYSESY